MARTKKARRALLRRPAREAGRAAHAESGRNGKSIKAPKSQTPNASISGLRSLVKHHWRGILAMVLLVGASYYPALQAGFVWDDKVFTEEPLIQQGSGIWRIWLSPADIKSEGHYWPVVYSSFWLEEKLWGLDPTGYHAVNILLHLVNCLLLWLLMLRLEVKGAWAVAAVFAVHPLHVESVVWVIERKDSLSALFYLAAVLAWVRFADGPRPSRYCGALALFALALLSKSIAVTLPAALLIWHAWKRGPVTRADWLRLVPFLAVAILVTAADLAFYQSREPLSLGYSLLERALIAARALCFYAGKLLWPADLAVIYPLWDVDASGLLSWGFLAVAVAVPALLWAFRRRIGLGPLVGAAFFAVTLSPVLGFVDYGYMQFSFVADRYQYLAGCGFLAVLISAGAHGAGRLRGRSRIAVHAVAAVAVGVLAAKTWTQGRVYRDEITLFQHIVSVNPNARDAHLVLAGALASAGRHEESVAASRIAVEQWPDSAKAHANLGRALAGLGRVDEAEESLRRARELDAHDREVVQNTAEMLRKAGRYEEALEQFRKAVAMEPDYALAYAGMGDTLFRLGRHEEALEAIARALSLQPRLPMAASLQQLSGEAAWNLQDFKKAAYHLELALEADPDDAGIHLSLGKVRLGQRRGKEANEHFRLAQRLRPKDPTALLEVGDAQRIGGLPEEALRSYRKVLASSPDPEYGIEAYPTPALVEAWDLSIPPDGEGLRKGNGTVAEGADFYARRCTEGHGDEGRGGDAEPLVGGKGTLRSPRPLKTVGSYWPNATTVWDYVNRAMPFGRPGMLTVNQGVRSCRLPARDERDHQRGSRTERLDTARRAHAEPQLLRPGFGDGSAHGTVARG